MPEKMILDLIYDADELLGNEQYICVAYHDGKFSYEVRTARKVDSVKLLHVNRQPHDEGAHHGKSLDYFTAVYGPLSDLTGGY